MIEVSESIRNIEVGVTTRQLSGGYLRIYGAPRPASPEVAVGAQVLFVECRFGSPAFESPIDGIATATPIAPEASILATGLPVWFRAFTSDGITAVLDGDIGTDMILDRATLAQGGSFSVSSLTYSRP